jgi:putative oxidoreductase
MAMTDVAADKPSPPLALMERAVGLLDGVPYTLLALPLRAAAATVFWNSAQAKLANWDTTIELFTDDYKVPLLPPEIAANMALGIELTMPVLLVLGLLTRAAALVLLGMTAVIEIFVYPQAWHPMGFDPAGAAVPRPRQAVARPCIMATPAPPGRRRSAKGVTSAPCSSSRPSPARLAATAGWKKCPRTRAGFSTIARLAGYG